jgi:transposase
MYSNFQKFVGIDVAAQTFISSIYDTVEKSYKTSQNFENNLDGFNQFSAWLCVNNCSTENSIICMEDTGCYSKKLAYFLATNSFQTCVEQPLKVKKAFNVVGHKTDASDSKQIAEYAFRYFDKLNFFIPKNEILDKIKQLLSTRELLVKQKTALKLAKKSYNFEVVQVELIYKTYEKSIKYLEEQISIIDEELDKFIDKDQTLRKNFKKLDSISGFGKLLSLYFIVVTNNCQNINYKKLSAFLGLCPYKFESGTSVQRRAKIRKFGGGKIKGLLRLASQSVATHDKKYREYYLRKQNEGKAKALALNNIANKLLKVACSVLQDGNSLFLKEHYSVNPLYLAG